MPLGIVREAQQGSLSQVHYDPRFLLVHDSLTPVLKHVYSYWSRKGTLLSVFNDSILLISMTYFLEHVFLDHL